MHQKLKATPGIYLVGFMGCGKSTVGRLLAERLGWDFVDLDAEIEAAAGKPIARIFDEDGEARFRDLEHHALKRQSCLARDGHARVTALGGGCFAAERNRLLLGEGGGLSIWLDAPANVLWERVNGIEGRPLARDRRAFEELLDARRPSYAAADYAVQAGVEPAAVVEAILALGLV